MQAKDIDFNPKFDDLVRASENSQMTEMAQIIKKVEKSKTIGVEIEKSGEFENLTKNNNFVESANEVQNDENVDMSAHISGLLNKYKQDGLAQTPYEDNNDLVFSLDMDESIQSIK